MKITLFTGAGASAPLGFPTTAQFMSKIPPQLLQNRLLGLAYSYLSERNISVDIEKVIAMLTGILEINDSKNFVYNFFLENLPAKDGPLYNQIDVLKSQTRELITNIKRLIFESYSIYLPGNQRHTEKLRKLYFPLFDRIASFVDLEDRFDIFTTNYDSSIEDFVKELRGFEDIGKFNEKSFYDGFPFAVSSPHQMIWESTNYDMGKAGIFYFKLHGSINWRYNETNQRIMQVIHERRPSDMEKYIVIYPGYKGIPGVDPYAFNHYQLATSLTKSRACIVIGFSMRDPYINSLFKWAMDYNRQLDLIFVIGRNIPLSPAEARKFLEQNYSESDLPLLSSRYRERVVVLSGDFGDLDIINQIAGQLTRIINAK